MASVITSLHHLFNTQMRFSFPFNDQMNEIPQNGIYIVFEKGETVEGVDRIVRIGTHTGKNQLRSRLREHFLVKNKDRSIFRKNIGRCLLNKESNPYLKIWEYDLTSRSNKEKYGYLANTTLQEKSECRVSHIIQTSFTFTVFQLDDKVDRLFWESRIASTLALSSSDEFMASKNWLGLFSPKVKIKRFRLWQEQGIKEEHKMMEKDFDRLKKLVKKNIIG